MFSDDDRSQLATTRSKVEAAYNKANQAAALAESIAAKLGLPPTGVYRIKRPDRDAQYLVAGGIRVWIKSQEDLHEMNADEIPLEQLDGTDTRWSFPLVGQDAPR